MFLFLVIVAVALVAGYFYLKHKSAATISKIDAEFTQEADKVKAEVTKVVDKI